MQKQEEQTSTPIPAQTPTTPTSATLSNEAQTPKNAPKEIPNETPKEVIVTDYDIVDLLSAVQLGFFMLEVCHKRGALSLEEAAKVVEALKMVKKNAHLLKSPIN